jgi:hypothetical protein
MTGDAEILRKIHAAGRVRRRLKDCWHTAFVLKA